MVMTAPPPANPRLIRLLRNNIRGDLALPSTVVSVLNEEEGVVFDTTEDGCAARHNNV